MKRALVTIALLFLACSSDKAGSGDAGGGNGGEAAVDARADTRPSGSGGSGGAADAGAAPDAGVFWSCLDVPGTLCFCNAPSDAASAPCSAGWPCCFAASNLGRESCECIVADEAECTDTIAMDSRLHRVAACPP